MEVGNHRGEVVPNVWLEGLAVAPLVDCHYPELLTQYRRDQVPDPAVGGEPMYEHNGLTLAAPVAIVERIAVDRYVRVRGLRDRHIRRRSAGQRGDSGCVGTVPVHEPCRLRRASRHRLGGEMRRSGALASQRMS